MEGTGFKLSTIKDKDSNEILLDPIFRKSVWDSICISKIEKVEENEYVTRNHHHYSVGSTLNSFWLKPVMDLDSVQGIIQARSFLKHRLDWSAKLKSDFLGVQ